MKPKQGQNANLKVGAKFCDLFLAPLKPWRQAWVCVCNCFWLGWLWIGIWILGAFNYPLYNIFSLSESDCATLDFNATLFLNFHIIFLFPFQYFILFCCGNTWMTSCFRNELQDDLICMGLIDCIDSFLWECSLVI